MYRVTIETPQQEIHFTEFFSDWASEFGDAGFLILNDCASPDLRLIHVAIGIQELTQTNERSAIPTLVHERTDQAGIAVNTDFRELIAKPQVKLWLKRNAFRESSHNNEPYMDGMWHCGEIAKAKGFTQQPPPFWPQRIQIQAADLEKIRMMPIVPMRAFRDLVQFENPDRERDIDVNLVALADYPAAAQFMIPWHRRAAARQIIEMKGLSTIVALNRALSRKLYLELLTRSRIVVSPWGLGEFAYRDYEAILAGCIMVKPNTDFVRTFEPDLYQSGKYYVSCQPDFANLQDVISDIVTNYSRYREMTMNARRELIRANSKEAVIAYFAKLFNSALNLPARSRSATDRPLSA